MLEVDVSLTQGDFTLEACFTAGQGVTALFGRSGAGKTTLVNLIAGLAWPRRGRIVLDGVPLLDTAAGVRVPPHRRRIGYVFQEARLFPHLTVRQNLLYGRLFAPRDAAREPLERIVDLLGIGALLDRRPRHLSGGERQRVAIGRALLSAPRLLLLDEPLASLDAARKAEILPYLERLRDELRLPMVQVSHQIEEVARLATTLVLLDAGRVAAAGPVTALMAQPDLFPLLGRFEAGTMLRAVVEGHDGDWGLTRLATAAGPLMVPRLEAAPGTRLRVRVRARDLILATAPPQGLSARNTLAGEVVAVGGESGEPGEDAGGVAGGDAAAGAIVDVALRAGGEPLLARVTRQAAAELGLAPGLPVWIIVKTVAVERRSIVPALPAELEC
nr:molybdenum ABC transporter ATP-binding protein [Rhodospirillum centenum]